MRQLLMVSFACALMFALASAGMAQDDLRVNTGILGRPPSGSVDNPRPIGVDVLFAPADFDQPNFRTGLLALGLIGLMDYFDAGAATPSLVTLQGYDVVITYPNYSYFDRVAMGNVLADYVDAGGKVILMVFCTYTGGYYLDGRIMTEGYSPYFSPTGSNHYSWADLGTVLGCCMTNGVTAIGMVFRDYLEEYPGTTTCAYYTDDEILAGKNPTNTVHYLNGFPLDLQPADWSGDWYLLTWNSIMDLAGVGPSATEASSWSSVKALYR